MRLKDIPDKQIPTADPADVIEQYKGWIVKIAKKYAGLVEESGAVDMDDLIQAGSMAILEAQKTFDPEGGRNFIGWSYMPIRNAMLHLLGYRDKLRLRPPVPALSLDVPVGEDGDKSLMDMIEDKDIVPFDEQVIEKETQQETVREVRAAVDRLKDDKQREAIRRLYLDEQDRMTAAEGMGIQEAALRSLDREGRKNLRKDARLYRYAMPFFQVGLKTFNNTWTSAVEMAVLWREQHRHQLEKLKMDAGG